MKRLSWYVEHSRLAGHDVALARICSNGCSVPFVYYSHNKDELGKKICDCLTNIATNGKYYDLKYYDLKYYDLYYPYCTNCEEWMP